MPFRDTKRHTITILKQTVTIGSAMGPIRSYAPESPPRQFQCTVLSSAPVVNPQLGVRAASVPHTIYITPDEDTGAEPTNVDERFRIQWEAADERLGIMSGPSSPIILRITSPFRNAQNMGLWVAHAEMRSEDNPIPTELG